MPGNFRVRVVTFFRWNPAVCRMIGEIYRRKGEKSSGKGEKRGIREKKAKKKGL